MQYSYVTISSYQQTDSTKILQVSRIYYTVRFVWNVPNQSVEFGSNAWSQAVDTGTGAPPV
jgi:hypothetical protein